MSWFGRHHGRHSAKHHQSPVTITVAQLRARGGHIAGTLPDGSHIEFPDQDTADAFADHLYITPTGGPDLEWYDDGLTAGWTAGWTLDATPPHRRMVR